MNERGQTLREHDVTDLIGLRVVVANVALEFTDENGEKSVEIPDIEALSAAAAVGRCLVHVRLLGSELRAIRKIIGWTATDLAARMGERTSPETISRWENEKQPMGGYAEKVFRLVVCEELKDRVPGVPYDGATIAHLIIVDPWRSDVDYVMAPIVFERVRMRQNSGLIDAWEVEAVLAA
jgi:transcriptional regulator with XRE-family HTH domain